MSALREMGEFAGKPVREVQLSGPNGIQASVMEWGACLRDLQIPIHGQLQRVVLGFPSLDNHISHSPNFGIIAGRFANRIAHGRFTLHGREYQLDCNQEGKHSLHGGRAGFGKILWRIEQHNSTSVVLELVSPDGDQGYPGNLVSRCTYDVSEENVLRIEMAAWTDMPTVINLIHHSYFNLDGSNEVLDHELQVNAGLMTPVDDDLIAHGDIVPVEDTLFDFRMPRLLRHEVGGTRFRYDHNFLLDRAEATLDARTGLLLARAATLRSVKSGLSMHVWTSQPALQVYDGWRINTPVPGLSGAPYGASAGICLEPQHSPNSPNVSRFASTVLLPGEAYRSLTEYRFS